MALGSQKTSMSTRISRQQLESYLWGAANHADQGRDVVEGCPHENTRLSLPIPHYPASLTLHTLRHSSDCIHSVAMLMCENTPANFTNGIMGSHWGLKGFAASGCLSCCVVLESVASQPPYLIVVRGRSLTVESVWFFGPAI